ncbi:hypothetical protein AMJ87_03685 [candidate division WOR_3 bacterium SM23_60]|uniref:Uncharacterized protein n=1 Tax=candidate division WOR_3 bacterium SM23_60 TaxID=1703780 RepID=A0A0S8GIF3_UNCW3|nr:MAG: hypothetical protein AMJ87_03685 [candidate division WOR_3 bacterium SM23_60]
MKKILAVLLLAIVIIGCGPKMAKQETLDALAEARAALDAAQAKIAELEGEMQALKDKKAELESDMTQLAQDIEMLQANIDKHCKK